MEDKFYNNKVSIVQCEHTSYVQDKVRKDVVRLLTGLNLEGDDPFASFIKPGHVVTIKPNWVLHTNPKDQTLESLVTNPVVVEIIGEYVLKALKGNGNLIIADAPLQGCDFEALNKKLRIEEMVQRLKNKSEGANVEIVDLRRTVLLNDRTSEHKEGMVVKQIDKKGDPRGYTLVNLGDDSLLTDMSERSAKFRVTMYDHKLMYKHHNKKDHEYLISNSILRADVVINIPKMKCHIKAGLTGCLKNLVGINGHKEYLPHHIIGSFEEGGDQYIYKNKIRNIYNKYYDYYWSNLKGMGPLKNWIYGHFLRVIAGLSVLGKDELFDGGWFGNITIPRTTIDLNNILYFYNTEKCRVEERPTRVVLNIVDGIVAGENWGPLQPDRKEVGILMAGFNPLLVDAAMGQLMGYEIMAINTLMLGINHIKSLFSYRTNILNEKVVINGKEQVLSDLPNLKFVKPKYWRSADLVQ